MLRAGSATATAAALGTAGLFAAGTARAATTASSRPRGLPYPPDVTDTSHCTTEVAEIFRGFFTAKSEHDAAGVMSYFSKANTVYADACLGAIFTSWQALSDFFTPYLPSRPAAAISYPLRIVGDARSAAVELVDTTAFFGYEIRAPSPRSPSTAAARSSAGSTTGMAAAPSIRTPSPAPTPPTSRILSRTRTPSPSRPRRHSRSRSWPATPPQPPA
jgi:hypothetical protein